MKKDLFLSFLGHYNCEHCGQTFFGDQAKRNFTTHLKKHTQPKVYPTCKYCNKVYQHQSEFKKHETNCSKKETMSTSEIDGAANEEVANDVNDFNIYNVKKVPADLVTSERDPLDIQQ